MKANTHPVDEARLGIMLNELRLPVNVGIIDRECRSTSKCKNCDGYCSH
ncbi:hypothetical protein [Devosia sp. SD17-2]|jgi:hypothetical protein|nr:hypothetical protein [Devosia sp. SD17-2]WEJ32736.1 hypothetical protein NYQ88_17925 [Devosia sp. SD17-2]